MAAEEHLHKNSISEKSVRQDPNNPHLTIPRIYGVYEIVETNNSKKFRYGNHPVREIELIRDFDGNVRRIALFLTREDSKNLADHLNS